MFLERGGEQGGTGATAVGAREGFTIDRQQDGHRQTPNAEHLARETQEETVSTFLYTCCVRLCTICSLTSFDRAEKLKDKERDLAASAEEAQRDFAEKQRNSFESLKTDEVLTLKESATIDGLAAKRAQQPPVLPQAVPALAAAPMPAAYSMTAPMNEAEFTALLMASPLYQKLEQLKKSLSSGRIGKAHKLAEGV